MPSRQSSKLDVGSTKGVDYRAALATNNEPASLNISLLNHDVVLKEGATNRVSVSAPDSSSSVADSSTEHRRGSSVVAGLRRNGSGISVASLNSNPAVSTVPMLPLHQQLHQQIVQQIRATHNASGKGTAAEIPSFAQPEPAVDSLPRVAEDSSTDIPTRNGSWTQRMVSMVLPTRAVQINLSTRSSSSSGSNSANNSATFIVGVGHNKVRPSPPPEGETNDHSGGSIARQLQSDYDLENQQGVPSTSDPADPALGLFRFSGKTGNVAPVRDGQSITLSTVMKTSVDSAEKPEETTSPPVDTEPSVFPPQQPSWERGLTILIVDDTPTNRKMLKKLLTSAGHKVFEAVDGVDCLEQLDFRRDVDTIPKQGPLGCASSLPPIDIVLMDEHMPRMEGPECTSTLKAKGFRAPVFAITGSVSDEETRHFKACGATAVFAKPLRVDALKSAVQSYFLTASR